MISDEEVLCRDLHGTLHRVRLADRGPYPSPGALLHQHLVTGPNDVPFLRKFVPVDAGRRDPRLYGLLDNEIRVIARLTGVLGDQAGEIPALVGYNMDVEEPFVLLRPYAGTPAPDAVRALDQDRRREFQVGVLRALHLIGAAGVVHGALSLEALRWNGKFAQLVDFGWAQHQGEPRRATAGARQSPERQQGTGVADPRDDVWSAGVLIRELVMGPQVLSAPDDQSGDPPRLRERLDGVFVPVDQRVRAADLLARMHVTPATVPPSDPYAGLADGYRRFEQACVHKGAAPPAGPPPEPGSAPARNRWWRLLTGDPTTRAEAR